MNKKTHIFQKIMGCTIFMMTAIGFTSAYNLTPKDIQLLDIVEPKFFEKIETTKLTATQLMLALYQIADTNLDERVGAIIDALISDLTVVYLDDIKQEGVITIYSCDDNTCNNTPLYNYDALYQVSSNNTISTNSTQDNTIRQIIQNTLPIAYKNIFASFAVITYNDFSAWVSYSNPETQQRRLTIVKESIVPDGEIQESIIQQVLVHELFHVISLSETQMEYMNYVTISNAAQKKIESRCTTHFVKDGCLFKQSYINTFIDSFWSQQQLDAIAQGDVDKLIEVSPNGVDSFVTNYAINTPEEDIADSFMKFVFDEKPSTNLDLQKNQKILFFYNYSELVSMRNEIRRNIGL